MAGYERFEIIGNLGRDVELRYTQSGVPVASFSVAVTSNWQDKESGEKREKTKWVRVTVWKKLAEICNEHLSKGSSVFCAGEAEVSAFAGEDGKPRASLEMTAREVQFLGGGKQSQGQDLDELPF